MSTQLGNSIGALTLWREAGAICIYANHGSPDQFTVIEFSENYYSEADVKAWLQSVIDAME